MTQTDQMNEPKNWDNEAMEWMVDDKDSARSDESAQSQDRERLQEDVKNSWERVRAACDQVGRDKVSYDDIRLIEWALGLGS